jgi:uncharacterized protein DUF397
MTIAGGADLSPDPGSGELRWVRSSRCEVNGSCAEVACPSTGDVWVRASRDPAAGHVLVFTSDVWRSFVDEVKAGRFSIR